MSQRDEIAKAYVLLVEFGLSETSVGKSRSH